MKKYILLVIGCLAFSHSFSQKIERKKLFFNQDSIVFIYCGGSEEITVISFVSDTSSSGKHISEYFLAVACIEKFGENFFKKGQKYSLKLHKNYSEIKSALEPTAYNIYMKKRNFYVLKDAKKMGTSFRSGSPN